MKLAEANDVEYCHCDTVKLRDLPDVVKELKKMGHFMEHKGGIGLAAPQVGIFKRYFIIKDFRSDGVQLIINPEVVKYSDKIGTFREGCLTYKGLSAIVKRSKTIKATWMTETGEFVFRKLKGREAQVFQHEFDHLNGITIKLISEHKPICKTKTLTT